MDQSASTSAAGRRPTRRSADSPPSELPHQWRSEPLLESVDSLSFLRQSLLFAELADIAYYIEPIARSLGEIIGFPDVQFFENDGSQAYLFGNELDVVVVCRGTEANDWNDIRADLNALTALAETVGRVHRGFKREVDDLWPDLERTLKDNDRALWFTGHSLGGAMASICAGRCLLSAIRSEPKALFTYGCPRVGNKRYVNYCRFPRYRWVNNNDIVTRAPPIWLGYRHTGEEFYLDSRGRLRRLTRWQRSKDRWRGFWHGIKSGRIDHFTDHLQSNYIRAIHSAVLEEDAGDDPLARRERMYRRVVRRLKRRLGD
ncbi:MAG: lipase family protein [Planctomycetales bacterium]|nr:lipase family protein [Planctomycetales bacterium]